MRRMLLLAAALAAVAVTGLVEAQSPPSPPHRFFGRVTLNGGNAPVGTLVEALIGDRVCGTGQTSSPSNYVVDVNQPGAPAGCGSDGATVSFRVAGLPASPTAAFKSGMIQVLDLVAPAAGAGYTTSALMLGDPRPCIPAPGQAVCDAFREGLWNGVEGAWRAQGVTDPDARFNETVVFRIRAGDPAVISIIARFLAGPYLQITRLKFIGSEAGQGDEYVEISNLGGGSQDMTGWTMRSPQRNQIYRFPSGFVMNAGQVCRIYTGVARESACAGNASFSSTDVWPDAGGNAVLYFDALDLLGADTRYSADRNNQPPPPNLQGIAN